MSMKREEVQVVMEKMGLFSQEDEEMKEELIREEEIEAMFEEKEPSLEEVKEAFGVFDENGDGFVDAEELKRVLYKLGYVEGGIGLDLCKEMIAEYDEDGNGKIDFGEFVRFMESNFY